MKIISRSEWGAQYPNGAGSAPLPARGIYLHHSVTIAPDLLPPFDDDDAAIRQLERIGQSRFKRGISYTNPITPVGRVYEGHSVDRIGSHTRKLNTAFRAICLVGDYSKRRPTDMQIEMSAQLLVHGKRQGWWIEARLTGGHRDSPYSSTACPGDQAWAVIPAINARAQALESGVVTPESSKEYEEETMKFGDSDRQRYGDGYATSGPVSQWQHTLSRALVLYQIPFDGGGSPYDQGAMLKVDGEFGVMTVNATTEVIRTVEREHVLRGRPIYAPHITDIGVTPATAAWVVAAVADKAAKVYA